MPTMANITIKKADGTTDIVWTALVPSAGDSSPARWASNTVSTRIAYRPIFSMSSQYNGARDARKCKLVGKYPSFHNDAQSMPVLDGNVVFDLDMTVPVVLDETSITEAVAQFANLLKSSLIQTSITSGYAPS